nr:UbiA family prenyltransferase [Hyphomicrobium methylovorum]
MGAEGTRHVSKLGTFLRLARVSNLPTVWSNVLAATALTGAVFDDYVVLVMLAASLLYTAGMVLNDAFDQKIDAVERPTRPIPSQKVSLRSVWIVGIAMLICGVGVFSVFGLETTAAALALAAAIVVYDAWHKGNPIAPFIMGLCRALVYIATAVALSALLTGPLLLAALALLAYVAGLTFAAKEESFDRVRSWWPLALLALPLLNGLQYASSEAAVLPFIALTAGAIALALHWLRRRAPGDVGRAVSLLIAAIALCDAIAAASAGRIDMALACCALFVVTVMSQRTIPGT